MTPVCTNLSVMECWLQKNITHKLCLFALQKDNILALRYHNRTVFEETTSWTTLTMHLGLKTLMKIGLALKPNFMSSLL